MLNKIKGRIKEERPIASFVKIEVGYIHYVANIKSATVKFKIPVNDIGALKLITMMNATDIIQWVHSFIPKN